jgi:HPt (histidine-containing phosphotransfer) domain-containing protein
MIRKIESQTAAAATPIFALTAQAFAEMQVQGYAAGFTSLLTKPIRKLTLLEAIAGIAPSGTNATEAGSPETFSVQVEEGMEDLAPGYLEKRRAEVALYRAALSAGDFDSIRKIAHKMKGTGSGYGFPRLTELGGALEKSAIESDAAGVAQNLDQFAIYAERVRLEYSK